MERGEPHAIDPLGRSVDVPDRQVAALAGLQRSDLVLAAQGVRRLAGVMEAEIELRATFGASVPARELGYQTYDGPSTDLS